MEETLKLVAQYGLSPVLVIFFVWSSRKEKIKLSERIQKLEETNINTVLKILDKSEILTKDSIKVVQNNNDILTRICDILNARPCVQGSIKKCII